MKKLQQQFTRKGFNYEMVSSTDYTFIFKKTQAKHVSFEVFEKRINPAREMHGTLIEESEAFPFDEAFGNWAFQCHDIDNALVRQAWLEERVIARNNALKTERS